MKYYLCNKENNEYKPIDLSSKIKDSTSILNIYRYVSGFESETELIEDLRGSGLLTSDKCALAYCLLTKNNLKPIYNGDVLYFSDAKTYFNPETIRLFFKQNKYNTDFLKRLYISEIRKYRIIDSLRLSFNRCLSSRNTLIAHLSYLSKRNFSEDVKGRMNDIIYYAKNHNLDNPNTYPISSMIDFMFEAIKTNDQDLFTLYHSETIGKVPTSLSYLGELYNMSCESNKIGFYAFETLPDMNNDVYGVINDYLTCTLTREHKKDQKTVINERNLVELGTFIYNYHNDGLNKTNDQTEVIEKEPEEEEEYSDTYYDEDDFLRVGIAREEIPEYGFEPINEANPKTFYHHK